MTKREELLYRLRDKIIIVEEDNRYKLREWITHNLGFISYGSLIRMEESLSETQFATINTDGVKLTNHITKIKSAITVDELIKDKFYPKVMLVKNSNESEYVKAVVLGYDFDIARAIPCKSIEELGQFDFDLLNSAIRYYGYVLEVPNADEISNSIESVKNTLIDKEKELEVLNKKLEFAKKYV